MPSSQNWTFSNLRSRTFHRLYSLTHRMPFLLANSAKALKNELAEQDVSLEHPSHNLTTGSTAKRHWRRLCGESSTLGEIFNRAISASNLRITAYTTPVWQLIMNACSSWLNNIREQSVEKWQMYVSVMLILRDSLVTNFKFVLVLAILVLVLSWSLNARPLSLSLSLPIQSVKSPYWKICKSLIVCMLTIK